MSDFGVQSDRTMLEPAYRQTHYVIVGAAVPFTLFIDQPSVELRRCYVAQGVSCSVFLTAWNPLSVMTDPRINQRAQQQLLDHLGAVGWTYLLADALDPMGHWPTESGVLVFGVDQHQAVTLGAAYQQNAVVWCDESATPTLRWCVPPDRC